MILAAIKPNTSLDVKCSQKAVSSFKFQTHTYSEIPSQGSPEEKHSITQEFCESQKPPHTSWNEWQIYDWHSRLRDVGTESEDMSHWEEGIAGHALSFLTPKATVQASDKG